MYQTLWNSINKQVKNSHAAATFLAVSLISWTTIGLLTGFLICMIGGMSFVTKVTVVLCSGGYTGLIFGFFGGILYLYPGYERNCSLTDYRVRTTVISVRIRLFLYHIEYFRESSFPENRYL